MTHTRINIYIYIFISKNKIKKYTRQTNTYCIWLVIGHLPFDCLLVVCGKIDDPCSVARPSKIARYSQGVSDNSVTLTAYCFGDNCASALTLIAARWVGKILCSFMSYPGAISSKAQKELERTAAPETRTKHRGAARRSKESQSKTPRHKVGLAKVGNSPLKLFDVKQKQRPLEGRQKWPLEEERKGARPRTMSMVTHEPRTWSASELQDKYAHPEWIGKTKRPLAYH